MITFRVERAITFTGLRSLTVAEVPQRLAAEIAKMQPTEAERQRGRVRRRIPKLGTDSVAVNEITRA